MKYCDVFTWYQLYIEGWGRTLPVEKKYAKQEVTIAV